MRRIRDSRIDADTANEPLVVFSTRCEALDTLVEVKRQTGYLKVHDRELDTLEKSDLVVAEVTTPSLGVGYLISQAINLNKKVIALYNGEDTLKLSAMIKGDKNIEICLYKTLEDVAEILSSRLS